MRIEGFSYSKGESSRVVSEDLFNQDKESLKTVDVPGIGAKSTDYTKGAPYKSTRIIFILSGGSKREKDYFRPLKTDEQIHSVKVAFRSKEGQGLKSDISPESDSCHLANWRCNRRIALGGLKNIN